MAERVLPLYKESLAVENYTQMDVDVLEDKYSDLDMLRLDPNLMSRQIEEIERILGHLAFEITMRKTHDS